MFDRKTLDSTTRPPTRTEFYRMAALIGLAIFAVLAVFQPFGTYVFEHERKYLVLAGYGLLVPLAGFVIRESIALLRPDFFSPARWTLRRELGLTGMFVLASIVASYFYHHLAIGGRLSVAGFFSFMVYALTTALLPLALLVIWRFFEVRSHLVASEFSEKLAGMPPAADPTIVLQGENKFEKLTLLRPEILFLRAADNYVEIFLLKDGQVQRLMLRATLAAIVQQLEEQQQSFQQVHRSYVLNFEHRLRLEGKSPAYCLVFEKAPEAGSVPVSRAFIADVRAILSAKPR
ncbi:MAG: LytTR family transcriptional regulator [Saprospiraceae bacterium]|nr:LytTR family transcriptional regulator [Saprospiraceae bacterium]